MKKFLSTLVVSLFAVVAVPVAVHAATPAPGVTAISGTVKQAGTALASADVTVSCNSVSDTDTTDSTGGYYVQFSAADCPNGAAVTAVASKGGAAGTNSGTANQVGGTKLNVAVVDVDVALPEMSTITGGLAAVAAGGALLVMRRRQLGQN